MSDRENALRDLVEQWRKQAFDNGSDLYAEGKSECANDLEEWINDE